MPAIKHIQIESEYEVVVWDVVEENEVLLKNLSLNENQLSKYNALTPKRQREFLGILSAMETLHISHEIFYDEKGKPFIKDNVYISLSHSYGKVAVAVSKFPIGVDIELKRNEKIQNISSKFIRKDEALFLPPGKERNTYLHIIWGIKEGLYKLNGGNLWNFLHHYKVEPFRLDSEAPILCWVIDEKGANKYAAFYILVDDYYLVWVIDILDII